MFDKKTSILLGFLAFCILMLIIILLVIYMIPKLGIKDITSDNKVLSELYYVSQTEQGYGISNGLGEIIIKPEYNTIARISNSVFLKKESEAYIYFLDSKTFTELTGKEKEVYLAYDYNKEIMPYYIFKYGESSTDAVYRIYKTNGEKNDNKDFASLGEAYDYIKAINSFKPDEITKLSSKIIKKYKKITAINYPTKDTKSQYIVENELGKFGVIDEEGNIIYDITADNIEVINQDSTGVLITKDSKTFILTDIEKIIEVDKDFEYIVEDNYIIQKRGNTVNKIYTKFGNVLNSNVYDYTKDLINIQTQQGKSYLLASTGSNSFEMFDMILGIKMDNVYENVLSEYYLGYSPYTKISSIMYIDNNKYMTLDLKNMKSYQLVIKENINSPLDIGNIYAFK